MSIFDLFRNSEKKTDLPRYMYEDAEIEELDGFITEQFGAYKNVFHELASPDIHLDICIVEPREETPYFQLVTMGAGAYRMRIPEQFEKYRLDYAEYVLCLPPDWNLNSGAEEDYWPIRLLKDVARLPIWDDTWLAFGHTTQSDAEGSPYAPNTGFNSVMLNCAQNGKGDIRMVMSSGRVINFYEIIPLYPEELDYIMDHDAGQLLDLLEQKQISYKVLDVNRASALR